MKKSASFVAALLALATVSLGSSAHAASGSIKDKSGDAPARFDVTRLKVSHTSTEVVITVKVRSLGKRDTQFLAYNVYGATTSFAGTSRRAAKGGVKDQWYERRSNGMVVPAACTPATTWNLKRGTIRTTISRACVPEVGTLKIKTSLGSGKANSSKQSDLTKKLTVAQD
ncbi:hypothetical protein [Nocardioides houyundeii]|uniref:hypothetical protein n=1 Tax=Nocardioides houyundeii TaxID=2045452 RepID=UPI000C77589F|nr:hypothetical protein [Nocardioides houyundeii]